MRNQSAPFDVSGCVGCPAHGLVSATASARKIVPVSCGLQHVVLTSDGKTSFLVRRKGKQVASSCPLLGYEVRRIEPGSGQIGGRMGIRKREKPVENGSRWFRQDGYNRRAEP